MNTSPKWRDDAAKALQHYLTYVNDPELLLTTCITCANFRENEGEQCALFNVRPPARVIAFGCEKYLSNGDIPF